MTLRAVPIDDPFFQGDALLLVEDERTRVSITECWSRDPQSRRIQVRAVGGRTAVESLVRAAVERGLAHVFGLVDRDLRGGTDQGRLFHTTRHEFENHLLDTTALAALLETLDASEIDRRLQALAQEQQHWNALRRALHDVKTSLPGTPPDPKPHDVPDAAAAQTWLATQTWPASLEESVRKTWTPTYLRDVVLPKHQRDCADEVTRGDWMTTFSGKEIFESLARSGGWRHGSQDPDELARLVVQRWKGTPPSDAAFVATMRDTILRAVR